MIFIRRTILPLLCILFAPVAFSQGKIVTVTGEAQISGDNTLGARQQALEVAFRKAVEEGLGVYVEASTIVQNFQLISDNIYSRASGYVSNHEVLNEGRKGNIYSVEIQATVNTAQLGTELKTLGILKNLAGDPKIMSLIQEVSVSSSGKVIIEDAASAIALEEELNKKGFTLVDREQVNKIRGREIANMGEFFMDNAYDDPEAIARIAEAAKDAGAQYLLMGSGIIEGMPASGKVFKATATFKCKIVDASTGEKLALTQVVESGAGNTPSAAVLNAGARAGSVAAASIIPQVIDNWTKKMNEGTPFLVKLYGVKSYAQQGRKFESAAAGLAGVSSSIKRAWDARAGRLELEVKFKGSGDDLMNAILDQVSTMPGFESIDIQNQAGNNIDFILK